MNGLLFIRHAQTDMAGTFCGHSDPPINSDGRLQVRELVAHLATERFDAIYSSDLHRAVDTADALAHAFGVAVVTRPALREIHFGDWEGLRWNEIEQRDAAYARRWIETFPALPAPGGESFAGFERRVIDEVDRLLYLAGDKRIAVVTHGGVMRIVLRSHLGYSEQEAWDKTKSYCCAFDCAIVAGRQTVML
jgi:broad specificity phosphatase PhoE